MARDAPASQTRKLIGGKLVEMDRQSSDVQVIIQGTNGDGNIYLVDETGIIKSIKVAEKHVSDKPQPDGGARSALRKLDGDARELHSALSEQISKVEVLTVELQTAQHLLEEERSSGREKNAEIATLKNQLATEKQRFKRHWREKCEQLLAHEESLEEKEAEIALLKARILSLTSGTDEALTYVTPTTVDSVQQELTLQAPQEVGSSITIARRGKAPPIDTFTGENCDVLWEDWLPTFERAAHWNSWSEDEKLLQLAGYLRRKALQEWNLLSGTQKSSFTVATEEMQNRLDPGSKAQAAQDFQHTVQSHKESVSDFICRLEQVFRRAYGKEQISTETRDTLLHGQLQEGLSDVLIRAPAV